jgi:8-oxo-dGTP diphosphatase
MLVWEPVYQAASAALVTRTSGQVLMVASPYRSDLVLPGGVVEADESPAAAAEREVLEETGLIVSVSRLLVLQHLPADGDRTSALRFVFDCASVHEDVGLRHQESEVSELLWLSPSEATARHATRGRHRLAVALEAQRTATTIYLDDRGALPAIGEASS